MRTFLTTRVIAGDFTMARPASTVGLRLRSVRFGEGREGFREEGPGVAVQVGVGLREVEGALGAAALPQVVGGVAVLIEEARQPAVQLGDDIAVRRVIGEVLQLAR